MPTGTELPEILVVTGIMAAGKSTVAQALAERLPRLGLWLDSSGLSIGDTVDAILARTTETRRGLP